jgi:hypothetical protein
VAVIGSGIMATRLSPGDVGLQLLENSIATGGALVGLILMMGAVSGAHFNPVVSLIDRVQELHDNGAEEVTGVRTGFYDLDRMTAGLQKGDLIVLAARPSMGKTAFALNIAENVAVNEGLPVLVLVGLAWHYQPPEQDG